MAQRPDGLVPGFGAPRHGRPPVRRRRPALWVAAAVATVLVFGAAGAVVLRGFGGLNGGHPASGASGQARRAAASGLSPSPAVASSPPPATVSIADVGDMNFGMDGRYAPGDGASLFAGVAGYLHSSLTVGNLETALGSSGVTKCAPHAANCYAFQAPAVVAQAVRNAGFSAVNVANNHTDDAGPAGISETDAALAAAHLRWAGRPDQTAYLTRHGIRIALLGFAPYDYDRNLLDIPAAAAAVRQAAARAQLVIVFIHAGAEGAGAQHVRPGMETYLGELRGDPVRFSHAVIRAGADLVLGSGPHVLRAMQWYRGRLIAYSLGNFAGYYTLGLGAATADSAILHVRLRADGSFAGGSITPVYLTGAGFPEPDPSRAGIELINSLSRADLGASAVRITPAGRIEPPRR